MMDERKKKETGQEGEGEGGEEEEEENKEGKEQRRREGSYSPFPNSSKSSISWPVRLKVGGWR